MSHTTGHHHIDEHHEELLSLDTQLDMAIRTCRRSELEPLIVFLEHYTQDHFKEEETLMQNHDFQGYAHHKSEHEKFVVDVNDIRKRFDEKKSATHIIFLIRKLIDSLVIHIKTVDISIQKLH